MATIDGGDDAPRGGSETIDGSRYLSTLSSEANQPKYEGDGAPLMVEVR